MLSLLLVALLVAASSAESVPHQRSGSDVVVSIGGKIVCESNPEAASNVTVSYRNGSWVRVLTASLNTSIQIELKDSAAVSTFDHLIASQKTDDRGRFELSGVAEEHWFLWGKIEPYLHIPSHHCGGRGNNPGGAFSWKKKLTTIKSDEFKEGFDYGKDHEFVIDATNLSAESGENVGA